MGYDTYHDALDEAQSELEAMAATRSNEPGAARANLEDAVNHYNRVTGDKAALVVAFGDDTKHVDGNKAMFLTDDEVETVIALRAGTAGVVPHTRLDMSEATDAAPLAGVRIKSLKASEQPRWDACRQDVELGRAKPTFLDKLTRNLAYGDIQPKAYITPPGFKDTHIVATGQGDVKFLIDLYTWLVRECAPPLSIGAMENLRGFIDFFVEHGNAINAAVSKSDAPSDIADEPETDRFTEYFVRQVDWSLRTFGPAARTHGILSHIDKEQDEIRKAPSDLMEWIDIMILAMDGYHRHGGNPRMLLDLLERKQQKNFARAWPDWRAKSEDDAIEHDRSAE